MEGLRVKHADALTERKTAERPEGRTACAFDIEGMHLELEVCVWKNRERVC